MKTLLIVALIIGLIYFVMLGKESAEQEKPELLYQKQVERVEQLPEKMQETVDQHLKELDSSITEK